MRCSCFFNERIVEAFFLVLQEFYLMLKDIKRNSPATGVAAFEKWGPEEVALNEKYVTMASAILTLIV